VYKVYVDDGHTGSHMDRPALKELLRDVWEGKIKSVVVYRLDRLSRDMQDMLEIIRRIFMPSNTRLISQTENIDTSTHVGRLAINIMTSFAELEKDVLNERMEMGRVGRVKTGKWLGKVPFGYDYNKATGTLVPNDDAPKVKQIYAMYLQGHGVRHIARTFGFSEGTTIMRILESKACLGIARYKGIDYPGQHEAIIDEETYALAMEKLKQKSDTKRGSGATSTDYLLVGLVVCGKCGAKMRYMKRRNFVEIICHSQAGQSHLIRDRRCDNVRHRMADLEEVMLRKFFEKNPDLKTEWTHLDVEQKRNSLHSNIDKIVLTDGDIEIFFLS